MSLFPMFVKLEGRRVLVVGAGSVGEAKIESLLATSASVRVVAPKATPRVREWAREGRIEWEAREYRPADFAGVFLVIAATGSSALHDDIYAEARSRGVLCNAVDEPERCDFYFPAVVRRGELQIAISTGGLSPALAQRLRKELEQQFGPGGEDWVAPLGRTRDGVEKHPDASGKAQAPATPVRESGSGSTVECRIGKSLANPSDSEPICGSEL